MAPVMTDMPTHGAGSHRIVVLGDQRPRGEGHRPASSGAPAGREAGATAGRLDRRAG